MSLVVPGEKSSVLAYCVAFSLLLQLSSGEGVTLKECLSDAMTGLRSQCSTALHSCELVYAGKYCGIGGKDLYC